MLLDGEDIWADPKKIRSVRFRVGLVFQYPEYQLFEETVYRDIAFGPTNMGLTGAELDRRVHDAPASQDWTRACCKSRPSRSPAGRSAASPSQA